MTGYYTHSKLLESISFSMKNDLVYLIFNSASLFLAGVLLFCMPILLSAAEVYQWEDKSGVVHFSDESGKIPTEYRDKAKLKDVDPSYNILPFKQNEQRMQHRQDYSDTGGSINNDPLREVILQKIADLENERKNAEELLQSAHRKYVISLGNKNIKAGSSLNSVAYRRKEYNDAKNRLDEVIKKIEVAKKSLD